MANLVITSTTNAIKVDFGVSPYQIFSDGDSYSKGTWRKQDVSHVLLNTNHVDLFTIDGKKWIFSHDGNGSSLQVDSIDAATPISVSDLYDKLIALIE